MPSGRPSGQREHRRTTVRAARGRRGPIACRRAISSVPRSPGATGNDERAASSRVALGRLRGGGLGRRRRRGSPVRRRHRIPRLSWATSSGASATDRASPSPWSAPGGSTGARGRDGRRGAEPFVPVSWPTAIDLLSRELRRVYDSHGGEAVYGGSYGWASAGRFHHAQSQLHRFLNCLGGFVRGEHSYSNGALTVIMPHVLGDMRSYLDRATAWSVIERHTELLRLLRRDPPQEHDGEPWRREPASPPGPPPPRPRRAAPSSCS